MTVPHRCTKRRSCGKYVTLRRHIDAYKRPPKCPGCGQPSLQPYYCMRIRDQEVTCKCGGIRWPHKRGLVLNENEFCHAIPIEDVETILEAKSLGGAVRKMKPDEDCPF